MASESDDSRADGAASERSSFAIVVPSWLVSLALHATLLTFFATHLKSCGDGSIQAVGDDFRTVGIYVKTEDSAAAASAQADAETQAAAEALSTLPTLAPGAPAVEDDQPPAELVMPDIKTPFVGPGTAAPTGSTGSARPLEGFALPNRIASRPAASGRGPGETEFFDIADKGGKFVYVLDRSGSMGSDNRLQVAKAELLASLEPLDGSQSFQIIFYNQTLQMLTLRGDPPRQMYPATDINRTLARQFVSGVVPDGGTDHLPALKRALALGPDVVFFLTDAETVRLEAGDLDKIRVSNGGRTRIHCIEFGKGSDLSTDNFLKKLARQNNGTYRYRDVTQFSKR